MKLQVERDHLADAVAWTARALPARPTAPVLAGMRLHAGNDLTLSTFDYEVSAQATVPVITDEEGAVFGRFKADVVAFPLVGAHPGPGVLLEPLIAAIGNVAPMTDRPIASQRSRACAASRRAAQASAKPSSAGSSPEAMR